MTEEPQLATDSTRRQVLKRSALAGSGVGAVMIGGSLWLTDSAPAVQPGEPVLGLTKFAAPLRIPKVLKPKDGELTVRLKNAQVSIHPGIPATPMWTYESQFPGPTVEVRRGERVRIAWQNELSGSIPLVAVEVPGSGGPGRPGASGPDTHPGRDGVAPVPEVAALRPWTAVHLHGAHTGGGSDGWAENVVPPGSAQLSEYPNDQPATALWYHDHAMHLTQYTVMSGLAGMYLIRDDEEKALGLPDGKHEVPLLLCDRNLDAGADGRATGVLLHKVVLGQSQPKITDEFYGPYTMVNGVIWPYLEVDPRGYRFRALNMSNARTYRLMLIDDQGRPQPMTLIGTDQGLLGKPVQVDSITLASAERADLVVDFSAFRGRSLRLVNTVEGLTPGQPAPERGIVEPDVMQFRVKSGDARKYDVPATLAKSFQRLTRAEVSAQTTRRWVVVPTPGIYQEDPPANLMWEMAEVDPAVVKPPGKGIIQIKDHDGTVRTLQRVASLYDTTMTFKVAQGSWEVWNFLALTRPVHPFHVHACSFQVLGRTTYERDGWNESLGGTSKPLVPTAEGVLDPAEAGWKDVVRVEGVDLVTVAARFDHVGRFVYHCHLLEHESHMMRPFVVSPPGGIMSDGTAMRH